MQNRQLLRELRALRSVQASPGVLEAILDAVDLGDRFASLDTALGGVFVAWNRYGVSAVMKTATPEEFAARFQERFRRSPRPAPELPAPFNVRQFDLRSVTEFERAVLLKALEIPLGEVRTYGWILRKNPVPVLIPCHRVVRSDGHIGQYALGGTDAKRAILAAEGLQPIEIERLARHWSAVRTKAV